MITGADQKPVSALLILMGIASVDKIPRYVYIMLHKVLCNMICNMSLYLCRAASENVLGSVLMMLCFAAGNSTPTLPHRFGDSNGAVADTSAGRGNRSRLFELNLWMWRYGRGQPRQVTVVNHHRECGPYYVGSGGIAVVETVVHGARGMSPKKDCLVFHSICNFPKILQNCGTREEIVIVWNVRSGPLTPTVVISHSILFKHHFCSRLFNSCLVLWRVVANGANAIIRKRRLGLSLSILDKNCAPLQNVVLPMILIMDHAHLESIISRKIDANNFRQFQVHPVLCKFIAVNRLCRNHALEHGKNVAFSCQSADSRIVTARGSQGHIQRNFEHCERQASNLWAETVFVFI
jgi:hypothetical protein